MYEFILSEDHKIEVTENSDGTFRVDFFENYSSCGWRRLWSEDNYTKEALEFDYEVKVA